MKTLTASLLAAQKKARARPYAEMVVKDNLLYLARYNWSSLYSGAEGDQPCHACITTDDYIVRVMVDAGTPKFQQITDPTVSGQWSSWTTKSGAGSLTGQTWAVADDSDNVWWFIINSTDDKLYYSKSTNQGSTFGGWTQIHACSGDDELESVCAAMQDDGYVIVFFSEGTPNDDPGDVAMNYIKDSGGGWGSATSWSPISNVLRIRGLTVYKDGATDFNILFGQQDWIGDGYYWSIQALAFGDGVDFTDDTWNGPYAVEEAHEATDWAYAWPSVMLTDVYRAIFSGYLMGPSYSRVNGFNKVSGDDWSEGNWTDPAPFQAEGAVFGMCLAYKSGGDGYIYAICSDAGYRAQVAAESNVTFKTTDRIKKYRLVDRWLGHKGGGLAIDVGVPIAPELYGEVWLDNSDGALNTLGSGSYAAVKRGSQVQMKRGYVTSSGNETSTWPYMWIEDYEYVADWRGRSYIVFYLIGPWGIFSAMSAHRQFHWPDDDSSVATILERLFGLAGMDVVSGGEASADVGTLKPWVEIHPGEDLRGGILKVLAKVPDFVYVETDTATLKELAADESSDYTYDATAGSGDHRILASRWGHRTPGYNHIEVYSKLDGSGFQLFGDDVDYDEVHQVGRRLQKVFDYGYDSAAECDDRAEWQLRKHSATVKRGEIATLPNVGLQLFDVVTVTDARCAVSSELVRVRSIEEVYDTTKEPLVYRQRLIMGAR